MTASKAPGSNLKIDQATLILSQIASIANETDRFFYYILGEFESSGEIEQRASNVLCNLRRTVCQIGMLADLACEKLTGSIDIRGGAEEWLLPPVYPSGDLVDDFPEEAAS